MADAKEIFIIVNAKKRTVPNVVVKYEEVVALVFPDWEKHPEKVYLVSFERAESKPHKGALAAGGQVTVRTHGTETEFDVTETNRS